MKKILLLGDSIRMGYDEFVREKLDGVAEVYFPEENGMFAQYTFRMLENWQSELRLDDADVVHWNNGLWDAAHLNMGTACGADEGAIRLERPGRTLYFDKDPLTPPDMYALMIARTCGRIGRLFPAAKIIFSLSTPVLEEQISSLYRSNEEIRKYNELAVRALRPFGAAVNDLYSFAEKYCGDFHCDWVHYDNEGGRLLAGEVADVVRQYL